MKTKLSKSIFLGLLVWVTSTAQAQDFPKQYRGTFVDAQTGAQLDITQSEAVLKTAEGNMGNGKISDLKYDKLIKGQAGMFRLGIDGDNLDIVEEFWVVPDVNSKKQAGDLVTYTAEVAYFRLDEKPKTNTPVDELEILHSKVGMITLDTVQKTWQIGWPSNREDHHLKRTK